jgi:outer membrane protein
MKGILVTLSLCLALPASAAAQSFEQALISAYENNPDLLAARAGLRATDEQVAKARAGWLPTVSLNSSVGRQSNTISNPIYSQDSNAAQAGVSLSQPLFDGGAAYYNTSSAKNTVLAGRSDLTGTEQTVLLNAATAYQDVLREHALLSLDREKEKALRQQFTDLTIRFHAGALTQTDADQAESRYLGAQTTTAAEVGLLQTAEATFKAVIGLAPQQLTPPPTPPNLPASSDEAARIADQLSPTVLGSMFRESAARDQMGAARSALLPKVNAVVGVGHDSGYTVPHYRANTLSATVNLTVPLYQGGANVASLSAARETAEQSRMTTLSSRRTAVQNAVSAFAGWKGDAEALQISGRQVTIAQTAYTGVERQAAIGARGTYELLGQVQELFDARAAQINLQHDTAVDSYQVLVALGRFTAVGLHLPVNLYDPTVHYEAAKSRSGLP